MNMKSVAKRGQSGRHRQRGMISVLIALIVLVITLLAAMAMMRSIDTSNVIAGSMSFRQGAVQEAAHAYTAALNQSTLYPEPSSDNNQAALGYYASPQTATLRPDKDIPDILVNATCPSATVVCMPLLSTGNRVMYVIERLCPLPGPISSNCTMSSPFMQGGSVGNGSTDNVPATPPAVAFRLSVKVVGPRGAIVYVQTVMR